MPNKATGEMVRLIDSATIDLNLNPFEWIRFRSGKAGIKRHTIHNPNAEAPAFFEMTQARVHDRKEPLIKS